MAINSRKSFTFTYNGQANICDSKISWDKTLPDWNVKKWEKQLTAKQPTRSDQEVLEMIDIYVFGDATLIGTFAVAYAVI